MKTRMKLVFAGLLTASSIALVVACSASGGGQADDSTGNGGDASSQGIDGSPVGSDGGGNDGASTDDGGGPLPDSGCPKLEAACRAYPNCGCDHTTCDFPNDGGSEVFCQADAGAATSAQFCTTTEDCVAGETCLFSKCRTYCGTLGTACPDPLLSDCRAHGPAGDYVCGIKCDLTNAGSCNPTPGGCVVLPAGSTAYTTECEPVGTLTAGQTCVGSNDCAPSLACFDFGAGGKMCKQRCTPTGVTGSCTTGTCTAESTPLTIDGKDYGYCQ